MCLWTPGNTDAIEYVEVHGLMDGLPGGLFAPNKELTRAEAVQILYNLEGQPTVTGELHVYRLDRRLVRQRHHLGGNQRRGGRLWRWNLSAQ